MRSPRVVGRSPGGVVGGMWVTFRGDGGGGGGGYYMFPILYWQLTFSFATSLL